MSTADHDLARTLASLPQWRWAPGMAWRRDRPGGQALSSQQGVWDGFADPPSAGCIPNLDDDATAGILLARVREAWVAESPYRWLVVDVSPGECIVSRWETAEDDSDRRVGQSFAGATLGRACAKTLIALWGKE